MIKSIGAIITKNFRLLIRSRLSALIILFGPLCLILFAGLAFDHSDPYAINIGVYSTEYSNLADSFIQKMSEKNFKITKFKTQEDCENSIRIGGTHACIVFPEGFSRDVEKNKISFTVDFSKINLVYTIIEVFTAKVTEESSRLRKEATKLLVDAVKISKDELTNDKALIVSLTTNTQIAAKGTSNIQSGFDNLDLTSQSSDSVISNFTEYREKLDTQISNFTNESIGAIDTAISGMNVAINATTDITRQELQSIKENLVALKSDIQSSEELIVEDFENFHNQSKVITSRLFNITSKIENASSEKSSYIENLL
ncbi:ABC transporter permease [Nanoarchaeota archaeon]